IVGTVDRQAHARLLGRDIGPGADSVRVRPLLRHQEVDELVVIELHDVRELALERLLERELPFIRKAYLGTRCRGGEVGLLGGDGEHAAAGRVRLERNGRSRIDVAYHRVQAFHHGPRIAARRGAGNRGADRLLVVEIRMRGKGGAQNGAEGDACDTHRHSSLIVGSALEGAAIMAQMKLPTNMRAVEIAKPGGPEVLQPVERPLPSPKPNEILIKVAAAGVNRPDVLQRSGNYPVPPDASDLP